MGLETGGRATKEEEEERRMLDLCICENVGHQPLPQKNKAGYTAIQSRTVGQEQ